MPPAHIGQGLGVDHVGAHKGTLFWARDRSWKYLLLAGMAQEIRTAFPAERRRAEGSVDLPIWGPHGAAALALRPWRFGIQRA